jgi:glucose/arabinose dehydrogenase
MNAMRWLACGLVACISALLAGCGLPALDRITIAPAPTSSRLQLDTLRLPPGFRIEVLSDALPAARSMRFGERGTLFVGSYKAGDVYALDYGQPPPRRVHLIASGLEQPHGIEFRDGALYVAEIGRILRYDDIESRLNDPPAPVTVTELPRYRHHGMRTLRFGPDGRLYFPIGAPCNICLPEPTYASLYRLDPRRSGAVPERIATGIRNSVGMDFADDGALWFTDNGRDLLGDSVPPDELNRWTAPDQHFGYPFCHGRDIVDPDFGLRTDCGTFEPPMQPLGAHVAALGMRFYRGAMFPPAYHGRIFIAEHGSWNRLPRLGYRISEVELHEGRAVAYRVFVDGWLHDSRAWGRPVDVEVAPDGALLVSDDLQGAVYRISHASVPN